jgi:hypothetical protein
MNQKIQRCILLLLMPVCLTFAAPRAEAQAGKSGAAKGKVVEITAKDLAKEFAKDSQACAEKYMGKIVRVSGKVSMSGFDTVYLESGVPLDANRQVKITAMFPEDKGPTLKKGDTAVIEGKYAASGVLGPTLNGCLLVPKKKNEPRKE